MKTLLYNPIFINPQAYYVFPRLTRYLQPDNESTSEPANYIGTIEVKVIAYGDTTLKRTYTNTDSIDLSEFKNTWINVSLFTKVGSCVLGEWKIGNVESDLPYIDPEVLASLKAVVIVGNKTNNDSDRAIVKNLVDPDNPFVISNAAFKLNSGFGGFVEDFTSWDRIDSSTAEISNDGSKIKCINTTLNVQYLFNYINRDISSFKVKISNFTKGDITYYYRKEDGIEAFFKITPLSVVNSDKVIELPKSYNTVENGTGSRGGFYSSNINIGVTIEQIPSFEGAFVTDGVNDLITSTKTVQEMLGGSNEITVVSMIHGIGSKNAYTNVLRESGSNYIKNTSTADGKTGIYGYTSKDTTKSIITDILGDKNDYKLEYIQTSTPSTINSVFGVAGWRDSSFSMVVYPIAWYWTIIANKVLTTDEINQVIAYYNLDRTLKPDILCNTIKQGITNENHAEFGDKLIDFSGNGRDIQLNNIAWDGDSGIGKYNYPNWKVNVTQGNKYARIVYYDSINGTYSANFKGITDLYKSYGLSIEIRVNRANTIDFHSIKKDGIYTITPPDDTTSMDIRFGGENVYNASCDITITQIPSHAGALCLDGVNDYGKVTGLPIYKDYTVIADYIRTFAKENVRNSPILSKSKKGDDGAFIFNYVKYSTSDTLAYDTLAYSFASINNVSYINDFERNIYYQSKYTNNGNSINAGKGVDTDGMWLGTNRDNDYRFFNGAIYSLMTFPYSMSEFLIERQLKKHKLGTLYPDMVEFRPVIKSNASYDNIVFYYKNEKVENGTYLTVGSSIGMHICLSSNSVNEIKSITINGIPATFKFHDANNNIYQYDFNLTSKSPQKINITIDEYIRYEDIVQPYPSLFTLIDYDTEEVYSWGSKLKVGARFKGNVVNLLPNMYEWQGNVLYNGEVLDWGINPGVVAKEMVFSWNMPFKYLIDNNEPKCILSPRLLRIPNSSYKILGYIPDISGHGNNGVIHNSAYAGMSGANGYPYDYNNSSFWSDSGLAKVVSGELVEYFAVKNSTGFSNITSGVYKGEIKVTGVTKAISENKISRLRIFTNSTTDKEIIDITQDGNYNIDIKGVGDANRVFFYAIPNNSNESIIVRLTEPIRIEQVGEYEGAYCLDGVDDFVTIPTTVGGKQVLMKVNWNSHINRGILYDQRGYPNEFAIYNHDVDSSNNHVFAYQARNNGQTYIDGILNNNINASELRNITHNITITNELSAGVNTSSPVIGSNRLHNDFFANMALYDFMLFDEISTDDKIKELNEYVGIEGNTE